MKKVDERFLEYVKIDTKSNEDSQTVPSTKGQLELGKILVKELLEIGMTEASIDDKGYVYASLKGNITEDVPKIGFISHMDTAPDMSGKDIKPQIIKNYDGNTIVLNKGLNIELNPKEFPELKDYIGKTLIATDGTTLLGADDKAGVSEIITAMEYLINHPEIKHGDIKVGFTPDDEIGRGADFFDVKKFGADFAYTLDGGTIGELEYENFNAACAKITIKGRNVHPGSAKNKMINSMMVANEFIYLLPKDEVPEKTEKYEGFNHLVGITGTVEETKMEFIIRDFFSDKFDEKKEQFINAKNELNRIYGEGTVTLEIKEEYRNMKEMVEPVIHIVKTAEKAMEMAGVNATIKPIRGGTDGARLSFMGLPTPNIFTGGENFHGRYEYVVIESMEKAVETILNIIKIYADK